MVILTFNCSDTQALFEGSKVRRLSQTSTIAMRKLAMLNRAEALNDLLVPPGNRLEALKGNRNRQYSIRINRQWRICFRWTAAGVEDVEIVDYH